MSNQQQQAGVDLSDADFQALIDDTDFRLQDDLYYVDGAELMKLLRNVAAIAADRQQRASADRDSILDEARERDLTKAIRAIDKWRELIPELQPGTSPESAIDLLAFMIAGSGGYRDPQRGKVEPVAIQAIISDIHAAQTIARRDYLFDQLLGLLEAPQAEKAPSVQAMMGSHRLMPIEPTEEIISAFATEAGKTPWANYTEHEKQNVRDGFTPSYRAMMLAAPQQPSMPDGAKAIEALEKILKIVQDYLPPGGTPGHKAMTQILEVIDPWPLDAAPKAVEASPTSGMNMAQRIIHVGGRNPPGSTYVEFGSIQAVEALVRHALRDAALPAPQLLNTNAVAEVYTMEALVPGGGVRHHVTLHEPLPAGTKLYAALQQPNALNALLPPDVLRALRFYGNGDHLMLDEEGEFDTVSGEPQNWLASGRDGDATMVEDGSVARCALQGIATAWESDDEPNPMPNEIFAAAPKAVQP